MPQGVQSDRRIRHRSHDGLYQIAWDSNGNPITVPASTTASTQNSQPVRVVQSQNLMMSDVSAPQQQQQHQQQVIILKQQQQPYPSSQSVSSSVMMAVDEPAMQLNLAESATLWSYTCFLGTGLMMWMLYLLLPRGFRKQYCSSHRKRYARNADREMPAAGYWVPANKTFDDDNSSARRNEVSSASTDTSSPQTPQRPPDDSGANYRRLRVNPPSPDHPALMKIPPNRIIAETMGRLQGRGIRLVAHGVHCDPKRVWIKLEDDTASVTWQTEFPRRVPNQSGQVSIVLMRGSLHRIALCNVLYIDVGKKTNAFYHLDPKKVPDGTCFSLLTQNGSLDLQANSKLERDALVSCFSMILDDVHDEDWRALYEASPPPSAANTDMHEPQNQGTEVAYGQSDLMVEI